MMAAYAVSLVFVERLFKVVKSKLMTMNWFANMAPAPGTDRKTASAFPALNRISIWRLPGPMRGNPVVKQWT